MKLLEIYHLEWSINSVCNVSDATFVINLPDSKILKIRCEIEKVHLYSNGIARRKRNYYS